MTALQALCDFADIAEHVKPEQRAEYLKRLGELQVDAMEEALASGDPDAPVRVYTLAASATEKWDATGLRHPLNHSDGTPPRIKLMRAEQFYAELEEGLAHDVRSSNQKNQQQNGGAHRGPDAAEAGGNAGVQPGDG